MVGGFGGESWEKIGVLEKEKSTLGVPLFKS